MLPDMFLHNGYSERAFQSERNGQWVKGRARTPLHLLDPFLATREELAETNQLVHVAYGQWSFLRQRSSTSEMIFDVPSLVSYVSQFMTLLPGDIISTGTPAGIFGRRTKR